MVGINDSMDMSLSKLQGNGEGQGSPLCCSPWSRKELDTIEQLNNKTCQNIDLCIYLSWLSWFSIVAPELLTGMGGLSLVAVNRLSCSETRGIVPDQGLNACPLHSKVNS